MLKVFIWFVSGQVINRVTYQWTLYLQTIRQTITLLVLQTLLGGIFLLIPYSHDNSIHVQVNTLITYKVSHHTLPPYFVVKNWFHLFSSFCQSGSEKIKIWKNIDFLCKPNPYLKSELILESSDVNFSDQICSFQATPKNSSLFLHDALHSFQ